MEKIRKPFADSLHELRDLKVLTASAMLLAVAVVLGFYRLQVTEYLRIGFDFIAKELTGMFFGPVVGCLVGGLSDLISFVVKPTGAYFPGFTISAMLAGIVYGFVLYRKPLSLKRIIVANTIVTVLINLLLNTYWITLMQGEALLAMLPARVVKQAVMLPVEIVLYYAVAKMIVRTDIPALLRSGAPGTGRSQG